MGQTPIQGGLPVPVSGCEHVGWKKEENIVSNISIALQNSISQILLAVHKVFFTSADMCCSLLFMWRICLWKWNILQFRCHKFRPVKVEVHYDCKPQPTLNRLGLLINEMFFVHSCGTVSSCFYLLLARVLITTPELTVSTKAPDIVTSSPV